MTYIYRTACAAGWIGTIIIAPGMMDQGYPIWLSLLIGLVSLALAAWGGWCCGLMEENSERLP